MTPPFHRDTSQSKGVTQIVRTKKIVESSPILLSGRPIDYLWLPSGVMVAN